MTQSEVFKQNWKVLRPKLRSTWMSLSDADVNTIDGEIDVLIELLKEKYGYSAEQAGSQVENFFRENGLSITANPS